MPDLPNFLLEGSSGVWSVDLLHCLRCNHISQILMAIRGYTIIIHLFAAE